MRIKNEKTGRPMNCIVSVFLLLLALIAAPGQRTAFAAMDTPHNSVINCSTCHQQPNQTWWTDQGAAGGLCGQCHFPGSPNGDAVTHISSTSYGEVPLGCSTCHDPHYQRQLRTFRTAVPSSYLATGSTATVTSTQLSVAGSPWTANQWAGMVLVPNTAYVQYNYLIESNTTNTITINTSRGDAINLTYARVGATFGINYGSLVRQSIMSKTVRFFRKTGQKSFADGDAVRDGVCEVCHTQAGQGAHPADKAGQDCTQCHSHVAAVGGFGPDCETCHGKPPVTNTLGGPSGLAEYTDLSGTGSNNEGKHQKHAVELAYACETCHTGYVMPQEGAKTVDLGFTNNGAGGGQYRGQATVAYVGHGGTDVSTKDGSRTCTNIYCHSTVQSGVDGTGAPTYKSVVWDSASAAMTCNDCHASAPATGSHTPHLGISGVVCNTCHAGNTHVDGSINVTSGGYNGGSVPQDGFGSCTTASCHDNGLGTPVPTPTWGQSITDCSECHAKQPATASHTKHLTGLTGGFNRNAVCGDCHDGAVEGTTAPSTHLDGDLDVFATTAGDLGYPQDVAKGGAPYNSCSTAYCHSNGLSTYQAATWGSLSTGCNFCHSSLPASGAHGKHVKTAATAYGSTSAGTTGGNNDFGCGNCHPTGIANHMNGTLDIVLNDGAAADPLKDLNAPTAGKTGSGATTVCNLTYCHSDGTKTGAAIVAGASPQWGAVFSGDSCAMCHGNSPSTGSHPAHVMAGIHYNGIYTGTTGLAAMGNSAAGAHGNAATATTINCNICHYDTVTSAANDKNASCSTAGCHDTAPRLMGSAAIGAAAVKHLNGSIDVVLRAGTVLSKAQLRGAPAGWTRSNGYKDAVLASSDSATINATDWASAGKTCTTACHLGQTSPAWGTPAACRSCHTDLP